MRLRHERRTNSRVYVLGTRIPLIPHFCRCRRNPKSPSACWHHVNKAQRISTYVDWIVKDPSSFKLWTTKGREGSIQFSALQSPLVPVARTFIHPSLQSVNLAHAIWGYHYFFYYVLRPLDANTHLDYSTYSGYNFQMRTSKQAGNEWEDLLIHVEAENSKSHFYQMRERGKCAWSLSLSPISFRLWNLGEKFFNFKACQIEGGRVIRQWWRTNGHNHPTSRTMHSKRSRVRYLDAKFSQTGKRRNMARINVSRAFARSEKLFDRDIVQWKVLCFI